MGDLFEVVVGTDTGLADTDGDGLNDEAELGQAAIDAIIVVLRTQYNDFVNPQNIASKSDVDALRANEVIKGYLATLVKSNPLVTDTDGGGVDDGVEVAGKTDPKNAADDISYFDRDGDGVTDDIDAFPDDKTESKDTDGDGVGDNADAFPTDKTETKDTDGDGVGDNADAFPTDKTETKDTDGDGVGDNADAFPTDETKDTDGDGVGDNADAFPADKNETKDTDGDGVGDNADAFPTDKTETKDTDGDGVGDNADAFPADKNETKDTDGDGVGDNADAFPTDKTETKDTDGDGVGDNADAFPSDKTETKDTDKDGVGDNSDNCPATPNNNQANQDADAKGDACDDDIDGDGVLNEDDLSPTDAAIRLDGFSVWRFGVADHIDGRDQGTLYGLDPQVDEINGDSVLTTFLESPLDQSNLLALIDGTSKREPRVAFLMDKVPEPGTSGRMQVSFTILDVSEGLRSCSPCLKNLRTGKRLKKRQRELAKL